jgi:hypothetical protein
MASCLHGEAAGAGRLRTWSERGSWTSSSAAMQRRVGSVRVAAVFRGRWKTPRPMEGNHHGRQDAVSNG